MRFNRDLFFVGHQGLDNRLIIPDASRAGNRRTIKRLARLGGMLNHYYRYAA
jgi:hypothetical protein